MMLATGCASTPPASPGNVPPADGSDALYQTVTLSTVEWVTVDRPGSGFGTQLQETRPVEGMRCVAHNGKGRWETVTPGTLAIAIGDGKLTIECTGEGFRPARRTFSCTTPHARNTTSGAMFGLQLVANPALAVMGVGAAVGALVGAGAAGAAAGHALTPADHPDVCDYGEGHYAEIAMTRAH